MGLCALVLWESTDTVALLNSLSCSTLARKCRHSGFPAHHEAGGGASVAVAVPLPSEPPASLSQPPSPCSLPFPTSPTARESSSNYTAAATHPVEHLWHAVCMWELTQCQPHLQLAMCGPACDLACAPCSPATAAVQQGVLHGVRGRDLQLHRLRGGLPPHRWRLRAGAPLPACFGMLSTCPGGSCYSSRCYQSWLLTWISTCL